MPITSKALRSIHIFNYSIPLFTYNLHWEFFLQACSHFFGVSLMQWRVWFCFHHLGRIRFCFFSNLVEIAAIIHQFKEFDFWMSLSLVTILVSAMNIFTFMGVVLEFHSSSSSCKWTIELSSYKETLNFHISGRILTQYPHKIQRKSCWGSFYDPTVKSVRIVQNPSISHKMLHRIWQGLKGSYPRSWIGSY